MFNIFNQDENLYSNNPSCKDAGTGKSFTLQILRGEQVCTIKIDNGVIKSNQKKCDYLIVRCSNQVHHFIELKGKNYDDAFEQLDNTIAFVKATYQKLDPPKDLTSEKTKSYILLNTTPPRTNLKLRGLQGKFFKKHKLTPKMKTGKFWDCNE